MRFAIEVRFEAALRPYQEQYEDQRQQKRRGRGRAALIAVRAGCGERAEPSGTESVDREGTRRGALCGNGVSSK